MSNFRYYTSISLFRFLLPKQHRAVGGVYYVYYYYYVYYNRYDKQTSQDRNATYRKLSTDSNCELLKVVE